MIPIRDNIPTSSFPILTLGLIAINTIVWLFYQTPDLEESVRQAGFFPCEINGSCAEPEQVPPGLRAGGPVWIVDALTSMFMHGSWIHIIGNMLFLWIFSNNVEDTLGRARFVVFYLSSGIAAVALQSYVTLRFGSTVGNVNVDALIPMVGASGAIAGVLGAYLVLFPRARVLTIFFFIFIIPVQIPAVFFLGGWFLFQLWQGGFGLLSADMSGGGVAFFAHIGGFVFGALTVKVFGLGRPPTFRRRPKYTREAPAWPRAER